MEKTRKKPVLFLHIGTGKTGSTALQLLLLNHQSYFLKNGICYTGMTKGTNNHQHLAISLMQEYCKETYGVPLNPAMPEARIPILETPEAVAANMKRTFFKNDCKFMIISYEEFYALGGGAMPPGSITSDDFSLGMRKYTMGYFKKAFKEFDIKIVCYFRRQDDFLESRYNQNCKHMTINEFNRILTRRSHTHLKFKQPRPEIDEDSPSNVILSSLINPYVTNPEKPYYTNLSYWREVFGKENIIVRPYERSQLPKGIGYDFVINVLGFDADLLAGINPENRLNVSLKKDIIEYVMATGIALSDSPIKFEELMKLNNSPALAYLNENNKKNMITAKQAAEILECCKEVNEKIAREYLNREDGILFYDKPREEKDDYPGLSLQAAIDISRELVLILKKENHSLETELEAKQAELNNLLHSRSWKITRPIRAVKRIFKHKTLRWIAEPLWKCFNAICKRVPSAKQK